ncbi:DUF4079 family protein [Egbenema bharatensis]|uniref:DUF4079 family protein n=1 Tax=Egbenema bharatensis TaxID=3463334 RepID=UPI003A889DF3
MNSDSLVALKPYLSLLHPIAMGVVAVISLYAMYLGIKVRRARLAEGDLKKDLMK